MQHAAKVYHIGKHVISEVSRDGTLLDPEVGQQLARNSGWLWVPLAGENRDEVLSCYSGRKRLAQGKKWPKLHFKPDGGATGAACAGGQPLWGESVAAGAFSSRKHVSEDLVLESSYTPLPPPAQQVASNGERA